MSCFRKPGPRTHSGSRFSETRSCRGGQAVIVTGAVEGDLDEALLRRILAYAGLSLGKVYGRTGKQSLLQSIEGYNSAARFSLWIVLIDLNGDFDCAPVCVQHLLPSQSENMYLRVAVRAAEAWVLGDRQRIAEWLGISLSRIPANPDSLAYPKQELVNLARRSRRRTLQSDLVPREGSGRAVGPLYTSRLIDFIQDETNGWRPDQAMAASDSLSRCVERLRHLAAAAET